MFRKENAFVGLSDKGVRSGNLDELQYLNGSNDLIRLALLEIRGCSFGQT
jgi:hypothetical protein